MRATLTYALLALLLLYHGLRAWLHRRQARHLLAHRDSDAQEKAADYAVARGSAASWETAARTLLLLCWTVLGGLDRLDAWLQPHGLLAGTGFALLVLCINEILLLPFAAFRVFRIEERFGFNRMTVRLFLADLLRGALVGLVLGGPLVLAALWLMRDGGRHWWLWAWGGWAVFTLAVAWIYPSFIAPLFNRFTPLPEGDLSARIHGLLDRTGFSSKGLFVMDGSRRSTHANAYFMGWGRHRQIVLFDTLCQSLAPDEIEAVLAHELGHFRLRHIWSGLAVGATGTLVVLLALAGIRGQDWFFQGLGVGRGTDAAALLLVTWLAPLIAFPLRPLLTGFSRRREYQADAFAARHADGAALARALARLAGRNATPMTQDPAHTAFFASHPPPAARIDRLGTLG